MEFSVLLADLRDVAEKYKGKSTEPQVSTNAYVDMFTKILERAEKSTEKYDDKITVLWVALNQLASIYKDLSAGSARDQLCKFIFGLCAKTVLNIQWSQLDDDSQVKTNFSTTVENVHEILSQLGFHRFQLILDLMESHWTHPILTKIMSGDDDDEDSDECVEYIQKEDPDILKLRIEIMINENCEEFALNLCNWSLKHPALNNNLKIKEHQIYILYRQQEYAKMQEVCETIVCHEGIEVMSHLRQKEGNEELCIRLAQVFLIQDWVKPERTCCTQELLQLWIHHQYLADKDRERFLDSIWTVAKVCRDTEQIGVLIDGVKKECGDMFIQLYTELCKYAINIDKGNMEREEVQSDKEEFSRRKLAMSKTCVRMAFMLMEHDFRMSRICGLTAFALEPTMDNLNLVNKLYWTHKNVSAASKNSKIDIATLYEIERLLGQMRPETLNPEYSWKQLIPLCKKYKSNHESVKYKMTSAKTCGNAIKAEVQAPVISTFQVSSTGKMQNSASGKINKVQMSTKDIEKAHLTKLLSQKNIPPDQIEQILSKHFPRNSSKDEAPQLNMKQLDKTINDLKKSIYLETEYRESMMQNLSSLHRSKVSNTNQSGGQNQHISRIDQFRQPQPNSHKNPGVQRQHSAPGISNSQGSNILHRQLSVGAPRPPTAHSHHRQQQFSPVGFGGSPPPAHSSLNRQQDLRIGSPTELGNNNKRALMKSSASSETVSEQLSKRLKEISHQQRKPSAGNLPFNILRPPGNDKQECAKIAQQIAELHEKKRAERERLQKIRFQGHLDGVKAVLNSRNIASKSQISNLLSLTLQGNKSPENKSGLLNLDAPKKSYQRKKNNSSPAMSVSSTISSSNPLQQPNVASTPGTNIQVTSVANIPKPPTKRAQPTILRQGEKMWDPKHGVMKQKYYLSSDAIKSPDSNQIVNPSSSDPNNVIKPVYSMVVPKSLTDPDRTEDFVNAVTNIIKQFPSGGETLHRVAVHNQPNISQNQGENIQLFTCDNLQNASVRQNESNIGSVGTQLGINSSSSNSNLTVVSQNGVCIPVTGQNINNIQSSNNGLLNLNTLANASVSMIGQGTNQQTQFQVSLQPAQQVFSPIVESQQLLTNIQTAQPMQQVQPNTVFSTPLYSVAQPFTVDNNVNIQSPVNISNTATLPVSSLQNPLVTLESSQCSLNVANQSQQQVSSQLTPQNVVPCADINNASTVQLVKEKPCLATPELSPALVQQILSSIKKKPSQDKQSPKDADSVKSSESIPSSSNAVNKSDEAINKGVIEAQKNILQLREQFEKASNAAMATMKVGESSRTVKSSSSTNDLIGIPKVVNLNDVNSKLEAVPELPDLGAKEFHIDDLLALDDGNAKLSNQSTISSASTNVTSVSGTTGVNQLVSGATSENKPDRAAQSTYMNANRLAKEREIREAQGQDTNRLNKSPSKTSQVKKCGGCGVSFPSRKLLCEHKKITKCCKPLKCAYCQMMFKNSELLKTHEKNFCMKAPVGIVKCHICSVYFESHEQLKGHLLLQKCFPHGTNHNGHVTDITRIVCGICDRKFENMQAIKDHVKTGCIKKTTGVNSEYQLKDNEYVTMFRCSGCKLTNTSEEIVTLHVEKCKNIHTTAAIMKLYRCCMCNEVFSECNNLSRHVSKQCPKLRVTNNQRQVQDSYQKLKNANMLQTNTNKQVKTPPVENFNAAAKQESAPVSEMSSKNIQNPSVSSTDDSKPDLKDIDSKSNLSISSSNDAVDLSSTKSESNASEEVASDSKSNVAKPAGDETLDENLIKLQKERRISAEKQFLAEFEKIEKRKREIRMEKHRQRVQMLENERRMKEEQAEMMEKQEKEKIEREKIEAEKKKFMEKILGKVSLQEKMKIDVSLQNKVLQVEVRKVTNENQPDKKKVKEVEIKFDNENVQKDVSEKRKSIQIKQIHIVRPKGTTSKTDPVNVSKKRGKTDNDAVKVVHGSNKTARETSEKSNRSLQHGSATSRTKKKLSPQDIRKLKGLRDKHLIKQKKYYMDEMFPAPSHRTKSVDSDRSEKKVSQNVTPKSQRKIKQPHSEDVEELNKDEREYLDQCRFCDVKNKRNFCKRFYLAIHYVRGHKIGYRASKYHYHCKFCGKEFPVSQTKLMKYHVFSSHPVSIIKNVAGGKYDFMVRKSGGSKRYPISTKRYFSPKKSDKLKKHMRAVALRQKCAEKLKQIAMHTEDSDNEFSEEEVDTADDVASPKENTDNTVSKSGNRIAPRLSRNLVNKSDSIRTRRQALSSEKDSDASSRLRSRSSSVSSNRSSIIVSARKRKIAMATARRNSSPGAQKGLTTRSGRALRSTESSGVEEDMSGTEDGCIKKRKSARIRKLSDRDKPVEVEPSETDDSMSDDVKPRVTRQSSRTQVDNNITDSTLSSRSTRNVGNKDRLKESSDNKTSSKKENRFSSLRSHTKDRRHSREESIITRQSSKNEEESDSVTESSSTDTESTIQVSNTKARRKRGVRSAESDSESTSYGDRRKRYKFRRRVSKSVYQESASTDDEDDGGDSYHEESDLEISGECEKFRSSDRRNSCDDESSTSYQYMAKLSSIETDLKKPRTIMLGPDDDDYDLTPLSSQTLDEESCDDSVKPIKSRPVVVAPENDDEFAGLETEPVVKPIPMVVAPDNDDEFAGLEHEPVVKSRLTVVAPEDDDEFAGLEHEPVVEVSTGKQNFAKEESSQIRVHTKAVERNNDNDVAKTMDKMLELIPSLSAENVVSNVNKNPEKVAPKIDNCDTRPKDDSQTKEYLNAYQHFVHKQLTPGATESDLNKSRGIINKEYLKSVKVVITDIASSYGKVKSKMCLPDEKLIEECHNQKCVVNIRRLSQDDLDQLQIRNHGINKMSKTNELITIETDEDSDDTIQNETSYMTSNDHLSHNKDVNEDTNNYKLQQDESTSNVTEVVIQDADITFSVDQMIAESNKMNVISSNIIHINTDNIEGKEDAVDVSYSDDHTNTDHVKTESLVEEGFSLVDKTHGDDSEDVWIENAETYAESIDTPTCCNTSNLLNNSEDIVSMETQNKAEMENTTQLGCDIENEMKPDESEQRFIIDSSSHNVVCTIGDDENAEGTVLQIQVDNDTDIVQLVVENVADGANSDIVLTQPETDVTTCNELCSFTENAVEALQGNTNIAEIDNSVPADTADNEVDAAKENKQMIAPNEKGLEEQNESYAIELASAQNGKLSDESNYADLLSLEHKSDNMDVDSIPQENEIVPVKLMAPELNLEKVQLSLEHTSDSPDSDKVLVENEILSVKSTTPEFNLKSEVTDTNIVNEDSDKEMMTNSKDLEETEQVYRNDDESCERLTKGFDIGHEFSIDSQNKTNEEELSDTEILDMEKNISEKTCQDSELVSQASEEILNEDVSLNTNDQIVSSLSSSISFISQHSVDSESDIESIDLDVEYQEKSNIDGNNEDIEIDPTIGTDKVIFEDTQLGNTESNDVDGKTRIIENNSYVENYEIVSGAPTEIYSGSNNSENVSNNSDLVKCTDSDNNISDDKCVHSPTTVENEVENSDESQPVITVTEKGQFSSNDKLIPNVEETEDGSASLELCTSSKESVCVQNELDNEYSYPLAPKNEDSVEDMVNTTESFASLEEESAISYTDNVIDKIDCTDAISDKQNEFNEPFKERMPVKSNVSRYIDNEMTNHFIETDAKSAHTHTTDVEMVTSVSCDNLKNETGTNKQDNVLSTDLGTEVDSDSIRSASEKDEKTGDNNLINKDVVNVDLPEGTVHDEDEGQTSLYENEETVKDTTVTDQGNDNSVDKPCDEYQSVQEKILVNSNENDEKGKDIDSDKGYDTYTVVAEDTVKSRDNDNDTVESIASTNSHVDSTKNDYREIQITVEVVPSMKFDSLNTDYSSKALDEAEFTTSVQSEPSETVTSSSCSECDASVNTSQIEPESVPEGKESDRNKSSLNESGMHTIIDLTEDSNIDIPYDIENTADNEISNGYSETKTTQLLEDANNVSTEVMIKSSDNSCSQILSTEMPHEVLTEKLSGDNVLHSQERRASDSSELSLISYDSDSVDIVKGEETLIEIHDERENPLGPSCLLQTIQQLNESHDTSLKHPESAVIHDDLINENNDGNVDEIPCDEVVTQTGNEVMNTECENLDEDEHSICKSDEVSKLNQNIVEVNEHIKGLEESRQENTASCTYTPDDLVKYSVGDDSICDRVTRNADNTLTTVDSDKFRNRETSPLLEQPEQESPKVSDEKMNKDIPSSNTLKKSKKRTAVMKKSKGKGSVVKTLAVEKVSDVSNASKTSTSNACQTEKQECVNDNKNLNNTVGDTGKVNHGDLRSTDAKVITTNTQGTKSSDNKCDHEVVLGKICVQRVKDETKDMKKETKGQSVIGSTEKVPVKSESSGKRSTIKKTNSKKETGNEQQNWLTGKESVVDSSTVTVSSKRKSITCYQMVDETDEDFRRRTESVRQARKKSASKSYESDFNFEESDTKSTEADSKLPNATFWQSDSEVSFDAVSFYSSSSGTSGGQSCSKDGTTKLHKRLARDFGQDVTTSLPGMISGENVAMVVSPGKQQGRIDMMSLSEKIPPGSVFKKLPSKILQAEVPSTDVDIKSDHITDSDSSVGAVSGKVKALRACSKDGRPFSWEESLQSSGKKKSDSTSSSTKRSMIVTCGEQKTLPCKINDIVANSSLTLSETRSLRPKKVKENVTGVKEQTNKNKQDNTDDLVLDKVKKLKALHNNGKPFKWEDTPSPPKRRRSDIEEIKTVGKDGVKKDGKNNTKSLHGKGKALPAETSLAVTESRTLRDKKGKDSASDKGKNVKTEYIKSEKLDEVSRKTRKSTETKSVEHIPVRTRSRSGTAERSVNVPGTTSDNDTVTTKQSKTVTAMKPIIHIVHQDHMKKVDVGSRQLRRRDNTSSNNQSVTGNVSTTGDNETRRLSAGKTAKRCKLDGTSSSPEIEKQIERKGNESTRPTRRQVIHAGKVFEFQGGLMRETDLQDFSSTETTELPKSNEKVIPVLPEIKRSSRRISDQRKRALSPEGTVYSNITTQPTNINKYIKETLEGIKKMRSCHNSPWKFHKPARSGTGRSKKTFPYEFKKS